MKQMTICSIFLANEQILDFVTAEERTTGSGKAVLEAKFDFFDSASIDRYVGQQQKYLSSHCECVILLAYRSTKAEMLRMTLNSRGCDGLHAVAIAVLYVEDDRDPEEFFVDDDPGIQADDWELFDASIAPSDNESTLPEASLQPRWDLTKVNQIKELRDLWDLLNTPAGKKHCLDIMGCTRDLAGTTAPATRVQTDGSGGRTGHRRPGLAGASIHGQFPTIQKVPL